MSTEAPSQPSDQSAQALQRYAAGIKGARIRYAAVIGVVVVAVSVFVSVIWLRGEISHATLRTATAPGVINLDHPSVNLTTAWSTTDSAAIGTPYSSGSVVTYDLHTVRGRNGRTGAQTWSYTRTDRVVCTAAQGGGVTVAVYQVNGNCDELTALDTQTGHREWTRTLDLDTHQINGVPAIEITDSAIMFTTSAAIYAIDLHSGYDDWLFSDPGCTISKSVLGSAGALISQTCGKRDCSNIKAKFCVDGSQLILRNGTTGENTDSSKNNGNPDQVIWTRKGLDLIPATAGAVIGALSKDGSTLQVFDAIKGNTLYNVAIPGSAPAGPVLPTAIDASDAELLVLDRTIFALPTPGASITWQVTATSIPTVTDPSGGDNPNLGAAIITVASATGIETLDPTSGTVSATHRVTVPATARVYPYGTGYIVASPHTVTVYR